MHKECKGGAFKMHVHVNYVCVCVCVCVCYYVHVMRTYHTVDYGTFVKSQLT